MTKVNCIMYHLRPCPISRHQIGIDTFPHCLVKLSIWPIIHPILEVRWRQLLMQKLVSVSAAEFISCCHPFRWLTRRKWTHIVDSPCLPRSIAVLDFVNSRIHILCSRPGNCAIMATCINNGSCPQVNCQVDVMGR